MRGATGLQMRRPDDFARYLDVVERAMWEDAEEPRRPGRAGGDAGRSRLRCRRVHRRWSATRRSRRGSIATTEEAVARGVFGAPTFFVGDAMFFGQDRLDFVREALLRELAERARAHRSVRSFQISGNSTTSSILRR